MIEGVHSMVGSLQRVKDAKISWPHLSFERSKYAIDRRSWAWGGRLLSPWRS